MGAGQRHLSVGSKFLISTALMVATSGGLTQPATPSKHRGVRLKAILCETSSALLGDMKAGTWGAFRQGWQGDCLALQLHLPDLLVERFLQLLRLEEQSVWTVPERLAVRFAYRGT